MIRATDYDIHEGLSDTARAAEELIRRVRTLCTLLSGSDAMIATRLEAAQAELAKIEAARRDVGAAISKARVQIRRNPEAAALRGITAQSHAI